MNGLLNSSTISENVQQLVEVQFAISKASRSCSSVEITKVEARQLLRVQKLQSKREREREIEIHNNRARRSLRAFRIKGGKILGCQVHSYRSPCKTFTAKVRPCRRVTVAASKGKGRLKIILGTPQRDHTPTTSDTILINCLINRYSFFILYLYYRLKDEC
jgi:hypothetical protein